MDVVSWENGWTWGRGGEWMDVGSWVVVAGVAAWGVVDRPSGRFSAGEGEGRRSTTTTIGFGLGFGSRDGAVRGTRWWQ